MSKQDCSREKCANCRCFFNPPTWTRTFGQCRKDPPIWMTQYNVPEFSWPETPSDGWCSWFKPQPVELPEREMYARFTEAGWKQLEDEVRGIVDIRVANTMKKCLAVIKELQLSEKANQAAFDLIELLEGCKLNHDVVEARMRLQNRLLDVVEQRYKEE